MKKQNYNCLNNMIFKNVSTEEKNNLLKSIKPITKEYFRQELIFEENALCDKIAIIRRGCVKAKIFYQDGHETVIRILNQNEIIGLSLIFSSSPYYKASFYAETLTTITLISKLDLLKMMKENDTIQKNILSLISDYSIEQSNHIRLLSYKTIRQKLCAFLYMQAKEKKATTFLINYTKTELALFLNVERPSLSKELSKLIQEGLIANQNKLYTIINEKKLSEEL